MILKLKKSLSSTIKYSIQVAKTFFYNSKQIKYEQKRVFLIKIVV